MGNTSIRNFHCSKIYYLEFMCVNLIYIGFASIPNFGLRTLGGSVSCGTSYTPKYQQALPRLCTVFLFIFNFSFFCVESSDFTGPKGWIPSFLLRGKLSPILIEKEKAFPLLASDQQNLMHWEGGFFSLPLGYTFISCSSFGAKRFLFLYLANI